MKSKILRIMGVGLTLAMVLSLTAIMAVPAAAGENEWTSPAKPTSQNGDGDWLYGDNITAGPGPMAMAIDGTLYAFAELNPGTGAENHILTSDDGRAWDETDYEDDVAGGPVVDIACSSLDADTLYATDSDLVYYTTDGGDKWETVGEASLEALIGAGSGNITSVDVAYDDDEAPYVFIGTEEGPGSVYYICQSGYPAEWTDLAITLDTYAVAASPEFADTGEIFAISDNATGAGTAAYSNINGEVGGWDTLAELLDEGDSGIVSTGASRICFPSDFDDDNYEFFVGVSVGSDEGSVYRIDDSHAYCLGADDSDIEFDIISLDIVGSYSDTMLIAGTAAGTDDKVIVSMDDGDSWDDASKDPSGAGGSWVVFDPDFADNGTAWVACDGTEGAVSMTLDGGDLYNQVSLIATDVYIVNSLSFSRNYLTDGTWFLLTTSNITTASSLWRNDGDNWERVFCSELTTPDLDVIDTLQVSPVFPTDETLYVADSGTATIYRSTDGGNDWDELSNQPDGLDAMLVVNDDIVLTAEAGHVYYTTNHGRRAWEDESVSDLATAVAFGMSPNFGADDTLLLGDVDGQIFISEDIGESWDQVGDALTAAANTIPTFDIAYGTNGTIYAASGNEVDRCVIDTDDDWADQEWSEFTTAKTDLAMLGASGLSCAADGTLYAADGATANTTAGGVWRALNPTDDMGDVVFELVGDEFELAANTSLKGLRITAGSNILWCMDSTVTNEVWQYEDTMATAVTLEEPWSNSGIDGTHKAWLSWEELAGADEYELKYTTDEAFRVSIVDIPALDDAEERIGDDDPGDDDALSDGTMYYWKVKATEPLLSRWSKVWSFTTALEDVAVPVTWEPDNGAQGVIIQPSFGWTAVGDATTYELELADNPDFTGATKATTSINSWVSDTALSYNTTYYWRVKALKGTVVVSDWVSGAFTTTSKAAPAVEVTPAPPAPQITVPAPQVVMPAAVTPMWVWAIIAIGAILVITVVVLIARTRRAL